MKIQNLVILDTSFRAALVYNKSNTSYTIYISDNIALLIQIADLIMLDASSVDALLCSEEMMREYFVFPDTVDVSKIVQGTCGLNATLLMLEFENTFQVMGLIDRVSRK